MLDGDYQADVRATWQNASGTYPWELQGAVTVADGRLVDLFGCELELEPHEDGSLEVRPGTCSWTSTDGVATSLRWQRGTGEWSLDGFSLDVPMRGLTRTGNVVVPERDVTYLLIASR